MLGAYYNCSAIRYRTRPSNSHVAVEPALSLVTARLGNQCISLPPANRVPHPRRIQIVGMLSDIHCDHSRDDIRKERSARFTTLYADTGRPSIPPERLLRVLLLQILDTIRSERLLMEQLNYNSLFRWFVGMGMDEACGEQPTRLRILRGVSPRSANCL